MARPESTRTPIANRTTSSDTPNSTPPENGTQPRATAQEATVANAPVASSSGRDRNNLPPPDLSDATTIQQAPGVATREPGPAVAQTLFTNSTASSVTAKLTPAGSRNQSRAVAQQPSTANVPPASIAAVAGDNLAPPRFSLPARPATVQQPQQPQQPVTVTPSHASNNAGGGYRAFGSNTSAAFGSGSPGVFAFRSPSPISGSSPPAAQGAATGAFGTGVTSKNTSSSGFTPNTTTSGAS